MVEHMVVQDRIVAGVEGRIVVEGAEDRIVVEEVEGKIVVEEGEFVVQGGIVVEGELVVQERVVVGGWVEFLPDFLSSIPFSQPH